MKVKTLIKILQSKNQEADVMVRYETNVVYSEVTSGPEDRIGKLDKDAILESDDTIIFAADLMDCN